MTEKDIKEIIEKVKEEGYNIIYFDYDVEYALLRVIKHKRNSTIIRKELYEVYPNYTIKCIDVQLAHFE